MKKQEVMMDNNYDVDDTSSSSSDCSIMMSNKVIENDNKKGLKEYSVIYTSHALNSMSEPFMCVMKDLNSMLKSTYNGDRVAIIPGSGTYGMEAVAREFASDKHVMVLRNGYFSYRWTEIFEIGGENHSIPKSHTVLKAVPFAVNNANHNHKIQYAPHPIEKVVSKIYKERPAVFFAPHVETSTGIILPDDYIRNIAKAVHDIGGIFVLDCIASGTIWVDMKVLGIDVLISAPQKGWSGPACAALVIMSQTAAQLMEVQHQNQNQKHKPAVHQSFCINLYKWTNIMDKYLQTGGFGYHTTMPTDALRDFHKMANQAKHFGMKDLKHNQSILGLKTRRIFQQKGLISVAAPGFQAPGVLVYYSPDGASNAQVFDYFKAKGLQIAAGVQWKIDEPEGLRTFRIGLFGIDKLCNITKTIHILDHALNLVLKECKHKFHQQTSKL